MVSRIRIVRRERQKKHLPSEYVTVDGVVMPNPSLNENLELNEGELIDDGVTDEAA